MSLAAIPARAADPYKSIKLVVAVAVAIASTTVIVVRRIAEQMTPSLGQTAVDENKPASSGNGTTSHLGADWLFRAPANVDVTPVPSQPAVAFVKSGKMRPIAAMPNKHSAWSTRPRAAALKAKW